MPIIVIHVITSFVLIVVVLIQHGQSDMGAVFGGSSQTVFGGSGAGNFLTRFTTGLAITFMCTSLLLAMKVGQGGSTSSVMTDVSTHVSEPVKKPDLASADKAPLAVPTLPKTKAKPIAMSVNTPKAAPKANMPPVPNPAPTAPMPLVPGG